MISENITLAPFDKVECPQIIALNCGECRGVGFSISSYCTQTVVFQIDTKYNPEVNTILVEYR